MDRNDLPLFLRVKDIASMMKIGRNQAYELTHLPDFPVVRLGHRIVVPRDQLFEWIDRQVGNRPEHA